MRIEDYLHKMRDDWDARARANARHFVADGKEEWGEAEFYASGEQTVAEDILTDMVNICQERDPKTMRVLELGCGAARVTRALAQVFGEVHAVDVSSEMVRQARSALKAFNNAFVYQVDGMSLQALSDLRFEFAYSCCMFHHISSYEVIRNYVHEVGRLLVPGALFKFEVQGHVAMQTTVGETWLGVPFSYEQANQMARECGFELRYHVGVGEERFWLWCFKAGI